MKWARRDENNHNVLVECAVYPVYAVYMVYAVCAVYCWMCGIWDRSIEANKNVAGGHEDARKMCLMLWNVSETFFGIKTTHILLILASFNN